MNPRQRFRETLLFGKPDKVQLSHTHAAVGMITASISGVTLSYQER